MITASCVPLWPIGADEATAVLLYGPPGSGKTTLARLLATVATRQFVALLALNSGVKELRDVMNEARRRRDRQGRQTVLFIDEVHCFSRAQQDLHERLTRLRRGVRGEERQLRRDTARTRSAGLTRG